MIALLLATAQIAEAPADSDITVVATRMKKIRLAAQTNKKGRVTSCQVTVSSGDIAFDQQACLATRDCAAEGKAPGAPMTDCVDRRLIALVTAQREDRRFREKLLAPN